MVKEKQDYVNQALHEIREEFADMRRNLAISEEIILGFVEDLEE